MGTIKKIIVGLDLTKFDETVLNYLKTVNMIARPEKVTLLNIHDEVHFSKNLLEKFPDLKQSVVQEQIQKLKDESLNFNIVGADIEYIAHEGNPLEEIMKAAKSKNADLIVVGKKKSKREGVSHEKLARASYCDVLIVTETSKTDIKNVLVATDFSKYSKNALIKAIDLADQANAKLNLLHVYHVPNGYSKTGKSFEEFAVIMKANAQKDCEEFLSDVDSKGVEINPVYVLADTDDDYEHIITSANASKADLIVVGAKGRTNLSAFFVGSVAEKLINLSEIPLYISKNKGEKFGFLDVLTNQD